jgi:hypothetical protein
MCYRPHTHSQTGYRQIGILIAYLNLEKTVRPGLSIARRPCGNDARNDYRSTSDPGFSKSTW